MRLLDYLCKRLLYEHRCGLWVPQYGDTTYPLCGDISSSPFPVNFVTIPYLHPLRHTFDALLVQLTTDFTLLCLKDKRHMRASDNDISFEQLLSIVQNCQKSLNLPHFKVEIWEVYAGNMHEPDRTRLSGYVHASATVMISAVAIDELSQSVEIIKSPMVQTMLSQPRIQQIVQEYTTLHDTDRLKRKSIAGNVKALALGTGSAIVLAWLVRAVLWHGWAIALPHQSDIVFSGIAIGIALLARPFKFHNIIQGCLAGGVFGVCYAFVCVVQGEPFAIWMILYTLVYAIIGALLGRTV